MQNSHIEKLLRELAKYLNDGEVVRVSKRTASLSRWGRLKALGFASVDRALSKLPIQVQAQRRY